MSSTSPFLFFILSNFDVLITSIFIILLLSVALQIFNYRKWDNELFVTLSKHLPDLPANMPQHVSIKLENANSDQSGTIRDIQRIFVDNFNSDETKSGFGVVGLHPCGDLAATLLRLYASRCGARFICIVGCCYMKLTLEYARVYL